LIEIGGVPAGCGAFEIAEGGSVANTNSGFAIEAISTSDKFELKVSGGTVASIDKEATYVDSTGINAKVAISGGAVSAEDMETIAITGAGGEVGISGGTVSAKNFEAVYIDGINPKVTVTGGFVFAYGTAVTGSGNVIDMGTGHTPAIAGIGVVCAWNKAALNVKYNSETTNDMSVAPAGTASWGVEGSISGIAYANGANTGFFSMNAVTVTPTAYTVKFETNGGAPIANQMAASGSKITKPADPEKEGFEFKGWYKDEALAGAYNFDAIVKSAVVLYAKWEKLAEPEPEPEPKPAGSMANFAKKGYYIAGMFTDVDEDAWYGFNKDKVIAGAYEYGLMKGDSLSTFDPKGNITVAQAITVAARVHGIYATGKDDLVPGAL
jgi:uncharacterized repeat protein (TIGR02543 family)